MKRIKALLMSAVLSLAVAASVFAGVFTTAYADDAALFDTQETILTLVDAEGEEIAITEAELEAATCVDGTMSFVKNENVTPVTAKFYSMKDILTNAGIDYAYAHGLKVVATDGFITGYTAEEVDELYIYETEEGKFRLAIDGSAGNKWASDPASATVVYDHVWFFKKGECKHYCAICDEDESSYFVTTDGVDEEYFECEIPGTMISYCAIDSFAIPCPTMIGEVEWTSSDESIAKVDNSGLVYGISYGRCFVYAKNKAGETVATLIIQTYFEDVDLWGWDYYRDPVYWAADEGITKGMGDGTFGVGLTCTRRQFVTFLWRMAGCPEGDTPLNLSTVFTDLEGLDPETDGYKAIVWACIEGIIKGYEDGSFQPNAAVTRKDALIMLYRYCKKPEVSGNISYADVLEQGYKETSDSYKAILWAEQNGITYGYEDKTFRPIDDCLREQVVTFLYRLNAIIDK